MLLTILVVLSLLSIVFNFLQPAPTAQTNAPVDLGPIIVLVTARAMQLSPLVKLSVDRIGQGFALKGRTIFILAMVLGIAFDLGLGALGAVSGTGYKFTLQTLVMSLFAGPAAGWLSKAMTDNHESAKASS